MIAVIVMIFCMVFIAVGAYLFLNRPHEGDECEGKDENGNYEIDDEGKCVLDSCASGYYKSGKECLIDEDDEDDETVPNVLTDPVGTPIQCTANDVGSGVNAAVYRYMGGDELRHYPNPPIATSWDPDWATTFKKIDCEGLTEGDKMPYNVTVGDPVQCNANDVGSGLNAAVYRVAEGGVLRHYPNPPIATSWDSDWGTTFKKIDCQGLTQGEPMAMKP